MLRTIIRNFIALIAGSLLPLAFAPFGYYPLAVLALAILLFLWLTAKPWQAFVQGLMFGLGFFGFGISWVFISIHTYGNACTPIALVITGTMILFLALYPAFNGYLLNRIYPVNNLRKLLLAFPATWMLFEWVRTWLLSGFPWLLLGNSQIDSPLRGFVPIIGEAGLAFLVAFSAAILVSLWVSKKNWQRALLILLAILLWGGGLLLNKINWTHSFGVKTQVSLIQGNIPQEQKWEPKQLASILGTYVKLTNQTFGNKLVVWPEGGIPTYPQDIKFFLKLLSFTAKLHGTTIISGIPIYDRLSGRSYNGAIAFGATKGIYLKKHLVPFGEYLPFKKLLCWLPKYLTIPMSGYSSGPKHQELIIVNGMVIAPFICYEIAFADLVLSHFPRANILLTLCDDSWFGKSIAAEQHLAIARMRSLETGRYQLLSTNTGITAVIDPKGKVLERAPEFKEYVLTTSIQGMRGLTPWVAFMHYFILILALLCLWLAARKK